MASIFAPVAYLVIVVGALLIFSRIYRRRIAAQEVEQWFPEHPERDTYISLLQCSDPPAADQLLKAALLRRAVADVVRVNRMREDKAALQQLLQKDAIPESLWTAFQAAEKQLEAEIVDVVTEANSFHPAWGTIIFASANEILMNEKLKAPLLTMQATRAEAEQKYGSKVTSPSANTLSVKPSASPSITPSPSVNGDLELPKTGSISKATGISSTASTPSKKGKKRK
ncbi:Translocation protein sec66 [Rhizoctonia solani AG-1 IB]|uniref:Translocation protein sec66 n=1 Tax=Thanatephorus cucumeris (strain AG1-IB / isolate 7/3/14) TaxID=1108050 RepID=M5BM90_THACB|nr:Translocation protein sec66 [Rhizoctonia solani AG-1 IB]